MSPVSNPFSPTNCNPIKHLANVANDLVQSFHIKSISLIGNYCHLFIAILPIKWSNTPKQFFGSEFAAIFLLYENTQLLF